MISMSRIPQNIPCREARTSALTILGIETLEFQLPNEFRELQLLGAILVLNLQELKATHELHVWFVGLLYSRFCFWMYNIYYHYPIGPIHKICIHDTMSFFRNIHTIQNPISVSSTNQSSTVDRLGWMHLAESAWRLGNGSSNASCCVNGCTAEKWSCETWRLRRGSYCWFNSSNKK